MEVVACGSSHEVCQVVHAASPSHPTCVISLPSELEIIVLAKPRDLIKISYRPNSSIHGIYGAYGL